MKQHGDDALAKAREKVAEMRARGDPDDGAAVWRRIIVAIASSGRRRPTREV